MKEKEILKRIEEMGQRSKWIKGVLEYAQELLENLENGEIITKERLLNGAKDLNQYSWGGCSLIYDCDICGRLATASEQKRTRNGELKPNKNEEWLDCQARALFQASAKILRVAKNEILEK